MKERTLNRLTTFTDRLQGREVAKTVARLMLVVSGLLPLSKIMDYPMLNSIQECSPSSLQPQIVRDKVIVVLPAGCKTLMGDIPMPHSTSFTRLSTVSW